jgi:hypothetical protein
MPQTTFEELHTSLIQPEAEKALDSFHEVIGGRKFVGPVEEANALVTCVVAFIVEIYRQTLRHLPVANRHRILETIHRGLVTAEKWEGARIDAERNAAGRDGSPGV